MIAPIRASSLIIIQSEQVIALAEHHVFDRFRYVALFPKIGGAPVPDPRFDAWRDKSCSAQRSGRIRFERIQHGFRQAHRRGNRVHMISPDIDRPQNVPTVIANFAHRTLYHPPPRCIQLDRRMLELSRV